MSDAIVALSGSSMRLGAHSRERGWRTRPAAITWFQRSGHGILMTAIFASVLDAGAVAAQSCFAPHPLPQCRSFWITESGLGTRLGARDGETKGSATIELGFMVNRSPRSALGAAAFLQLAEPGTVVGLRPRYRRWLTGDLSIDVAPGIVLHSFDGNRETPSFSGVLALNLTSRVSLTTEVNLLRGGTYDPDSRLAWYAGARLGGGLGVAGAVVLGLAALALTDCCGASLSLNP